MLRGKVFSTSRVQDQVKRGLDLRAGRERDIPGRAAAVGVGRFARRRGLPAHRCGTLRALRARYEALCRGEVRYRGAARRIAGPVVERAGSGAGVAGAGGLFLEHPCRYRRGRRYVHAGVVRLLGARARLAVAGVGTDDAHRRRHWLRPDRRVHGVHDDRRRAAPVRDGYLHRRQRGPRHPGEPFGGALRALVRWLFLIGFWAVATGAMLGSWNGGAHLFADYVRIARGVSDQEAAEGISEKSPWFRAFLVWITFPPMVLLIFGRPITLVIVYASLGALFFPFLALTLLYLLNSRRVDPEYRNRTLTNVVLVAAVLLFIAAGVQEVLNGLSGRAGG